MRITSVLIGIVGLLLTVWSTTEICRAPTRAAFVAQVSRSFNTPVDPDDWATHWRVSFAQAGVFGCLLLTCAAGFWRRKPVAALWLALAVAANLLVELLLGMSGYLRYAFEVIRPAQALVEVIFIAAATLTWLRLRARKARIGLIVR